MVIATITRLRQLIRAKQYVVSHHAADELDDDDLTIFDLESIILSGVIVERQHDARTDESKHLVQGRTLEGRSAEAVIKIGFTGCLIVITVYVV